MSAFIFCVLLALADGRGCGQPAADVDSACSDWQCSRSVKVGGGANSTWYCLRGLGPGEGPCSNSEDCYHALTCNATSALCIPMGSSKNAAAGYVGVAVAVFLFGTNYIPARHLRSGNGVFFQFAMAVGILVVGVGIQCARQSTTVYPAAMLGGMFWAIGNCASVRAINAIGMGLAVTTWGCSNMLVGWAGGRFGAWGMNQEIPSSEAFSALGVVFGLVAIVVFGFVKPAEGGNDERDYGGGTEQQKYASLVGDEESSNASRTVATAAAEPLSPSKRIAGFVIALACGVCYGFNFFPSQAMMDHYAQRTLEGNTQYSPNGLDYSFSMFLGIFLTSVAYLLTVLILRRRFPVLDDPEGTTHPCDMFPYAFASGVMWAGANAAWFVANTNLGLVVSYPLIALGPCVVASVVGAVLFGELRGKRNMILLSAAFAVVGVSCVFTVLSKE
jgi:glucose uptake protein GlcU